MSEENIMRKCKAFGELSAKSAIRKVEACSTVDAVPVIRCKDCKYWMPHTQLGFDEVRAVYHDYCAMHCPDDDFYAYRKRADDYCSWAERKEENEQ